MLVEVTAPPVPFLIEPELKVPVTPDSFASGQPSPSESKSNRFGIPSPSVSISIPQGKNIFKSEKGSPTNNLNVIDVRLEVVINQSSELLSAVALGVKLIAPPEFEFSVT